MSSVTLVRYYERQSVRRRITLAFVYLALVAGAVVILAPFVWMLSTALKVPGTEFIYPPQLFTRPLRWNNFSEGWGALPFTRWFFNTSTITLLSVTGAMVSSSLVAYGFARLEFPGRTILFVILLSTMMLPFHVRLIPMFITFRYLGWIDTYLPLIVPFWFGHAFSVFLLRQFFMTVPRDFDDAARIDGANPWIVFWRILMPLIQPALIAVGILGFRSHWNSFIDPLIYLNTTAKYTLQLGLSYIKSNYLVDSGGDPHENWLMAGSIMVTIPTIVMFFVLQRHIVRGVVLSGLKQ
jgi:ABC-type glycerol-3-phosphate transport system permease component